MQILWICIETYFTVFEDEPNADSTKALVLEFFQWSALWFESLRLY